MQEEEKFAPFKSREEEAIFHLKVLYGAAIKCSKFHEMAMTQRVKRVSPFREKSYHEGAYWAYVSMADETRERLEEMGVTYEDVRTLYTIAESYGKKMFQETVKEQRESRKQSGGL